MREATVTLRIVYDHTSSTDPEKWDWHELLDMRHDETVEIVEVK